MHLRHGAGRADPSALRRFLDPLQIGATVQKGDRPQIAQVLCHPKPDIRRAANQRAVGMRFIPRGQFIGAARQGRVFRRFQPCGIIAHPLRRGLIRRGLRRADDRRIAGAAAQVSGKRIVISGVPVQMCACHRRDEPGGAEPALRSVMVDHRLLHRMKRAVRSCDAFDGAHRLAVKLRQEQDAGIQRPRAVLIRDNHGTGAAIAFVAPFLGSREAAFRAQPVKKRFCRIVGTDPDRFSVKKKANVHVCLTRRGTDARDLPTLDAA